ncbi:hypothetical protein G1H11_04060 [Phytoactinopolyspora alkaliphila]|uniref:Uncharacterized protein n=1 Tax=Phytoactinopolyspora alkaliphila TaxID=1783498 RepID=A0A6N9YHT2_9ACTN|nr:DsrE family protein [Phytoactinopolyspora alkaliphila]NED94480.1 hypothetical protein [Phytoactinopolyspora alkaliphila]
MKYLFVLHDPPYGTERAYNGLRWARQMVATDADVSPNEVKVFLFADAAVSAIAGQKTPDGYYNVASMLRGLAGKGATIGVCGTCADARGIDDSMMLPTAHRSSMAELAEWTTWADQVINI